MNDVIWNFKCCSHLLCRGKERDIQNPKSRTLKARREGRDKRLRYCVDRISNIADRSETRVPCMKIVKEAVVGKTVNEEATNNRSKTTEAVHEVINVDVRDGDEHACISDPPDSYGSCRSGIREETLDEREIVC